MTPASEPFDGHDHEGDGEQQWIHDDRFEPDQDDQVASGISAAHVQPRSISQATGSSSTIA